MFQCENLGTMTDNGVSLLTQGITATSDIVQAFIKARYGTTTAQEVMNNPNSDLAQQLLQMYLSQQTTQTQTQQKDNTMLYVLLGVGVIALVMTMNNNNSRR